MVVVKKRGRAIVRRPKRVVRKRAPRRNRMASIRPILSNKVHLFKKKAATESFFNLVGSTGSAVYNEHSAAETFQMDKIVNYADLTSNYDRYQIKGVQVKFTWTPGVAYKDGSNMMNGANDSYAPHLRWHVDYDDSGAAFWETLGADARTKTTRILPYKPVSIFVSPKVLVQLYETLTSTGYGPRRSPPIDTSDVNVPHYGLKYVIRYPNLDRGESVADSSLGQVQVEYTYYVKMMYPQT